MNITTRIILLFPLCFFLILSGCSSARKQSYIQYRDTHYLTAKSIPPLKIPPGISSNAFQNTYPVSDKHYPESAKAVSIIPPGL